MNATQLVFIGLFLGTTAALTWWWTPGVLRASGGRQPDSVLAASMAALLTAFPVAVIGAGLVHVSTQLSALM